MKFRGRELSDGKYQLDCLDGLRGAAVLLVFMSHTSNAGMLLFPHANFYAVGKSGVFLFFVLSSFLLTYPFVREASRAATLPFLETYATRRFFRIYPLYTLYLLLALATTVLPWKQLSPAIPMHVPFWLDVRGLLEHLLLIDGKGVTWSIAVEFKYYFVLPILGLTYSLALKNRLLPSALLTLALIILAQLAWPPALSLTNDQRLGPYFPIFLLGSFTALVYHRFDNSDARVKRICSRVADALGMLATAGLVFLIPAVASLFLGSSTVFVEYKNFHTQFVAFGLLWSLVLLACLIGGGAIRRIFELAALRYLGFISFSAYLWHVVVIRLAEKVAGQNMLAGWMALLLTVAISHTTWILIEKPTSRFKIRRNVAAIPTT